MAELKKKLPQEGTAECGESLSAHRPTSEPDCPMSSGGDKSRYKGNLNYEIPASQPQQNQKLVQQIFHKTMFTTRERSASASELNVPKDNMESNLNRTQSDSHSTPTIPWQRYPVQSQKRIRSPDDEGSHSKVPINKDLRQQNFNKARGIGDKTQTSNRFSALDVDIDPDDITKDSLKKSAKPPPIVLYGIDDLNQLTKFIDEVAKNNDYNYKVVSRNKLIITTKSTESYKDIIEHIRDKGLIGHTFTRKDQRCPRIVIKHLHFSTPKEAIIEAIEETGNTVKGEIVTARKKGTKQPINTFFVNILPHANNKKVKDIRYIYHQKVTIEDPIRKTTVVQCTRCQQYGHTKNNCMRPYRCVKCAGAHDTKTCTIDKNTPAICALCSGKHPASYKGCVVYKEILARKTENLQSKRTRSQHWQHKTTNPQNSTERTPKYLTQDKQTNRSQPLNKQTHVKKWHTINGTITTNSARMEKDHPVKSLNDSWKTINTNNREHESNKNQEREHIAHANLTTDNQWKSQNPLNHKENENYKEQEPNHKNFEYLVHKQAERIDKLLNQMETMMSLVMELIRKL